MLGIEPVPSSPSPMLYRLSYPESIHLTNDHKFNFVLGYFTNTMFFNVTLFKLFKDQLPAF
jgi:hypothetical protein